MKVIKQAVSGKTAFDFGIKCDKFLIKNYSSADISVSFSEDMPADGTITIKAGMGQIVVENEHLGCVEAYAHSKLFIEGSGEVEVQAVCYQ